MNHVCLLALLFARGCPCASSSRRISAPGTQAIPERPTYWISPAPWNFKDQTTRQRLGTPIVTDMEPAEKALWQGKRAEQNEDAREVLHEPWEMQGENVEEKEQHEHQEVDEENETEELPAELSRPQPQSQRIENGSNLRIYGRRNIIRDFELQRRLKLKQDWDQLLDSNELEKQPLQHTPNHQTTTMPHQQPPKEAPIAHAVPTVGSVQDVWRQQQQQPMPESVLPANYQYLQTQVREPRRLAWPLEGTSALMPPTQLSVPTSDAPPAMEHFNHFMYMHYRTSSKGREALQHWIKEQRGWLTQLNALNHLQQQEQRLPTASGSSPTESPITANMHSKVLGSRKPITRHASWPPHAWPPSHFPDMRVPLEQRIREMTLPKGEWHRWIRQERRWAENSNRSGPSEGAASDSTSKKPSTNAALGILDGPSARKGLRLEAPVYSPGANTWADEIKAATAIPTIPPATAYPNFIRLALLPTLDDSARDTSNANIAGIYDLPATEPSPVMQAALIAREQAKEVLANTWSPIVQNALRVGADWARLPMKPGTGGPDYFFNVHTGERSKQPSGRFIDATMSTRYYDLLQAQKSFQSADNLVKSYQRKERAELVGIARAQGTERRSSTHTKSRHSLLARTPKYPPKLTSIKEETSATSSHLRWANMETEDEGFDDDIASPTFRSDWKASAGSKRWEQMLNAKKLNGVPQKTQTRINNGKFVPKPAEEAVLQNEKASVSLSSHGTANVQVKSDNAQRAREAAGAEATPQSSGTALRQHPSPAVESETNQKTQEAASDEIHEPGLLGSNWTRVGRKKQSDAPAQQARDVPTRATVGSSTSSSSSISTREWRDRQASEKDVNPSERTHRQAPDVPKSWSDIAKTQTSVTPAEVVPEWRKRSEQQQSRSAKSRDFVVKDVTSRDGGTSTGRDKTRPSQAERGSKTGKNGNGADASRRT